MEKLLLFIVGIFYSITSSAIVIRHDVADQDYISRTEAIQGLVTFTTRKDGKSYVVGSGTYIGNGWVLTAAHVANFFEDADIAEVNKEKLQILDVILHEKWRDRRVGYDIALVKVSKPAQAIAPVSLFRYKAQVGDVVTIAGKGDTGNGIIGMQTFDLQLRVAQNKLDKVEGQWLSFTFDKPGKGALPFEGMCGGGDSGSPAYIVEGETVHIVGLSSWQDTEATNWQQGFYGAKDYYTRIIHYKNWILENLPDPAFLVVKTND